MAIFKGTGVAIVTPMHEDGKVNFEKLEEILEDQIANSTDAIVICGTTGESSTLTHGEHLQTIKFTIDKVNKPDHHFRSKAQAVRLQETSSWRSGKDLLLLP